jgi:phosphoribosylaminoimidazolecarboxamide formyltransferase / IMP cyclohydrolase
MTEKIQSALISVFYKDGLEPIVKQLNETGVTIYSTGGTMEFIEKLGIPVVPVEDLTSYPSILGGRVKTLHPNVFGGILGRREIETDILEMKQYNIPIIDLVIVDLYPFEETVASTDDEKKIIEKIDIGGPSMIRAAAKNFKHVAVVANKESYPELLQLLIAQNGETSIEQRRAMAVKAFEVVTNYDIAISNYFGSTGLNELKDTGTATVLRYGENPHQQALFNGNLNAVFTQLHGKELSYNNLVDTEAAIQLISEFSETTFAIFKHTNVCGIASRDTTAASWKDALAGDPESAFGGVLICNGEVDKATAEMISEIFFEVLIADSFSVESLDILKQKKNRILLQLNPDYKSSGKIVKSLLNGILSQDTDEGNFTEWKESGGRNTSESEKGDLEFANLVCKHLKSNAIALVKNKQLIGKGCGQTSRIDALRQAIEKASQFNFELKGAVLASDAFFPFNDCVKLSHEAGIEAFIQPGGSIRDKDSIEYCVENNLAMVLTGIRHFKH